MNKILIIAINTFREALRNRILYSILGFAILMISSAYLLANMQVGGHEKIIIDVGFASINFFGVLIAIFLGVGLLNREIERRTIYIAITKPISRGQFLLGKLFGLNLTLLINLAVMLVAFYIVGGLMFGKPLFFAQREIFLKAFLLILAECFLLTSFAILFSTFSTVILSSMFCIGIYIVGHLLSDIKFLAERSESAAFKSFVGVLYYVLPNLETFNIKDVISHNLAYSWSLTGYGVLYSLLYSTIILGLAILIFSRRDYK